MARIFLHVFFCAAIASILHYTGWLIPEDASIFIVILYAMGIQFCITIVIPFMLMLLMVSTGLVTANVLEWSLRKKRKS